MNRLLLVFLLVFSSFSLSAQVLQAKFSVDTTYGCNSRVFKFHDLSTGPNPIVAWRWKFGVNQTSTLQNPTYQFVYTLGEVYVVSLTVIDSKGDTSTINQQDTIYVLPIREADYKKYYRCGNNPVEITTQASHYQEQLNGHETYQWTNGATTPAVTVNAPGFYGFTAIAPCGPIYPDSVEVIQANGTAAITPQTVPVDSIKPGGLMVAMAASLIYRDEDYGQTHWNWGDGTTTVRNAVHEKVYHQYAKAGKYTITCSVTLNYDVKQALCGDTVATYLVTVSDTNLVRAKIGILSQNCNTVTFADSSYTVGVGNITSKEWSFGDGDTSHLTHVYQKDSTYTVRLIVRNFYTGQNDTAYRTVKIQTQPLLNMISDTTIAAGTQITLKNLLPAIGNYGYEWSSGEGTPAITVSTTGLYALYITYCNKSAYDSVFVNVVSIDTPKVDYTYLIDGCNPGRVYLKSLVTTKGTSVLDSIVRYQWIIDNGILLGGKDTVVDLRPGSHSVILVAKNAAGVERTAVKDVIIAADTWKINAVIDNAVIGWSCIDTAHVIVTATTTNESYTISWNKPVVDRSFGRYIITYPGQYIAYLKDSCGNIRATDTLDINMSEPLMVSVRQVKDTLYGSLSQYTTSINTTYTWRWYRNDILLNGQTSFFIIPVTGGMYKAIVNSSNGCSVVSVPVNYTAVPDTTTTEIGTPTDSTLRVAATFNHNFNADNIFTAELMLDNNGGRTTGLQPNEVISLGSVNSSNGNITMDVKIPDSLACASNYIIRITASSPKDTTVWSEQFSIVNQPAQPVITQRGDSLFTSGIYNWQWYKNNVAIDGATNANYRARANASYTVEAGNGEGCSSKSLPVAVVITAVGEVTLGGNMAKVFPNPSEGQVYLQFSKPLLKVVTIKVYDLHGKIYHSRTTQQQLQQLDLANLPKGLYMIELSGYGTQKVLTIVLQ